MPRRPRVAGLAADVRTQPGCCPLQVLARIKPQHHVQASETQAERDAHRPASSNPQEKAWELSGGRRKPQRPAFFWPIRQDPVSQQKRENKRPPQASPLPHRTRHSGKIPVGTGRLQERPEAGPWCWSLDQARYPLPSLHTGPPASGLSGGHVPPPQSSVQAGKTLPGGT